MIQNDSLPSPKTKDVMCYNNDVLPSNSDEHIIKIRIFYTVLEG